MRGGITCGQTGTQDAFQSLRDKEARGGSERLGLTSGLEVDERLGFAVDERLGFAVGSRSANGLVLANGPAGGRRARHRRAAGEQPVGGQLANSLAVGEWLGAGDRLG